MNWVSQVGPQKAIKFAVSGPILKGNYKIGIVPTSAVAPSVLASCCCDFWRWGNRVSVRTVRWIGLFGKSLGFATSVGKHSDKCPDNTPHQFVSGF